MWTTVSRCLNRMVTEQRRTLHLPAVNLPMETFACLTLIGPSFSMHQYNICQFLMNTSFAFIALWTTIILFHSRQGTITFRIIAGNHTIVTSTTPARVAHWVNSHSMRHLQENIIIDRNF